jgi:hypothetical protein
MPFDGNCYLSLNGFKEIKNQLERHGKDTKYFVVPMTRLLNNSVLLNNLDERPKTPEEPQIIFRHDSVEEYNLNMRYGRRSKVILFFFFKKLLLVVYLYLFTYLYTFIINIL